MFYTQIAMMITAFVFAALVGSGHIQTWHILVLAALGGVAMAFDMPARQAFMVEMTSHEDLMNAVSLNSSIVNGARVVGPAVAGLLMASVGITWCFILNGVSFIAVIVGLLMMRLPKHEPRPKPHSTGRHIMEGFKYVAGHRRVRILLLLFGVVGIFGWSYAVLLPAYASDILHVGETGYGVLLSANGFGALLGALTVATYGNRVRPRLMILGGLWLFSAMLALLAIVRWYPLVLLCLAVGGWGMILYFSTTNTLIQSSVSNAMRGRVMGIWALVFGGMMPLGGIESGFLSHAVGVPWTIAVGAIICAGAGLVTWWAVRRNPPTAADGGDRSPPAQSRSDRQSEIRVRIIYTCLPIVSYPRKNFRRLAGHRRRFTCRHTHNHRRDGCHFSRDFQLRLPFRRVQCRDRKTDDTGAKPLRTSSQQQVFRRQPAIRHDERPL